MGGPKAQRMRRTLTQHEVPGGIARGMGGGRVPLSQQADAPAFPPSGQGCTYCAPITSLRMHGSHGVRAFTDTFCISTLSLGDSVAIGHSILDTGETVSRSAQTLFGELVVWFILTSTTLVDFWRTSDSLRLTTSIGHSV